MEKKIAMSLCRKGKEEGRPQQLFFYRAGDETRGLDLEERREENI